MGTNFDAGLIGATGQLPSWVPSGALYYLAHTENGRPIRALARAAGCHASTVLRQIRKVELRRDDPLVDAALRKLGAPAKVAGGAKRHPGMSMPDADTLAREAMRVLRRLAESGAVLAVAADLEKAVVVREMPGGGSARTAVVEATVAEAMALKDWIAPLSTGRITRYQMTPAGRTALAELVDRFGVTLDPGPAGEEGDTANARPRYGLAESPLSALARRRDKAGKRFLSDKLVQAGERLREDFELAQMEEGGSTNWADVLTIPGAPAGGTQNQPGVARGRVEAALRNLGPGLADVALHCCCYLEGLETTEKRLGWSARSGKIVLRIALMRLRRHYDETLGPGGGLIG